jgi:hypothetical protein
LYTTLLTYCCYWSQQAALEPLLHAARAVKTTAATAVSDSCANSEDATSEGAAGLADETERQRNRMREVCAVTAINTYLMIHRFAAVAHVYYIILCQASVERDPKII